MRGSKEPQKDNDRMCKHCGLYFSNRGHIPHERNCNRDEPLLPLDRHDDVEEVGEVEDGPEPEDPPHDVEGEPKASTPPDGVGTSSSPDPSDGGSPASDTVTQTMTDGGGLGLDGAPENVKDVDDDTSEITNTIDCPECGADTGEGPDDLEAGKVYRCTECENKFRWSP